MTEGYTNAALSRLQVLALSPRGPDKLAKHQYPIGTEKDIAIFLFEKTNTRVSLALSKLHDTGKKTLPKGDADRLRDYFDEMIAKRYGDKRDNEFERTKRILAHRLTEKRLHHLMDMANKRIKDLGILENNAQLVSNG